MALKDLDVFARHVYLTMTEMQDQAIDKFNGATSGGLILTAGSGNRGDYDAEIIWAKIQGLVRRRNAYGSGAQTKKKLTQLVANSIKIAAGTPPVEIDPGMLKWIKKSPEEAGAVIGKQMAEDRVADMLNTAITAYIAAVGSAAGASQAFKLIKDISTDESSGAVTPTIANQASFQALLQTARLFGDRAAALKVWLMHSNCLFDIHGNNLANKERLFTFGGVNVWDDGFGRTLVVTDSPSLVQTATGGKHDKYYILGLAAGAAIVETNSDEYTDNIDTRNEDENITRTYQAEWTYNVSVQGYKFDTTKLGSAMSSSPTSPTDAIIGASGNWSPYATSHKDTAGVILICNSEGLVPTP